MPPLFLEPKLAPMEFMTELTAELTGGIVVRGLIWLTDFVDKIFGEDCGESFLERFSKLTIKAK